MLSCAFLFLDEFWTSLYFSYLVILHLKWWDGWVPHAILEESFQFSLGGWFVDATTVADSDTLALTESYFDFTLVAELIEYQHSSNFIKCLALLYVGWSLHLVIISVFSGYN